MRINTSYAKQTLANLEEAGLQHYDLNAPPPYEVPSDFRTFFQEFGGLEHDGKRDPKTNRPLIVKDLAPYQYEFADLNYGFMLKCNKVGMTTSEMLRDFHYLLMPENAGFDILLQAAKIELANELLLNLKIKIQNSPKYRRYMITRPENILREQKSKMKELVIYNPYNPQKPSRILAIGSSVSGTLSRIGIKRIHITDPSTLLVKSQDSFFAGLFSRILNTEGAIKIEGVPGQDRSSWFYRMSVALGLTDDVIDNRSTAEHVVADAEYQIPPEVKDIFTTMKVTIDDAISAGVISERMKDFMYRTMPHAEFRRICMAEFPAPKGSIFGGDFSEGTLAAQELS